MSVRPNPYVDTPIPCYCTFSRPQGALVIDVLQPFVLAQNPVTRVLLCHLKSLAETEREDVYTCYSAFTFWQSLMVWTCGGIDWNEFVQELCDLLTLKTEAKNTERWSSCDLKSIMGLGLLYAAFNNRPLFWGKYLQILWIFNFELKFTDLAMPFDHFVCVWLLLYLLYQHL